MVSKSSPSRLGILGGTFDPIHLGHLIIAEEARLQLSLDKVLFIPTGQPYLRSSQPSANGQHRLAMVRLAVEDNPRFEVSTVELEREGPTYTVDTLLELREEHGPEAELFLIIGQDSLNDLPRWHRPQELVQLCTLVVAPRPGANPVREDIARSAVPGVAANARILRSPLIGISGTELRRRAGAGVTLRYWVPPAVEEYIHAHRLYRAETAPAGGRP